MQVGSVLKGMACALAAALIAVPGQAAPWSSGDLFTSFNETSWDTSIRHYDSNGNFLDSISLPSEYGSEVKGLAFGKEGWLYAVSSTDSGFGVTALDSNGTVKASYSGSSYVFGNLSYGKIAFGNDGNFFVAGGNELTAFTSGSTTGTVIYENNQVFDVKSLASGNLLVLSAYGLDEITSQGAIVRSVALGEFIVDARGLEYDAVNDDIYVSMLGYSDNFFQLMRFDGATGALEAKTGYWYGDDLLLTEDGQLIVGSRTLAPGIFDKDLNPLGTLGTGEQMFVAQYVSAVPEPQAAMLLVAGLAIVGIARRRGKGARLS